MNVLCNSLDRRGWLDMIDFLLRLRSGSSAAINRAEEVANAGAAARSQAPDFRAHTCIAGSAIAMVAVTHRAPDFRAHTCIASRTCRSAFAALRRCLRLRLQCSTRS